MKNHKKRVYKEGDIVHVPACRCVVSCGYEHTFDTCLKELAIEAGMSERDIEQSRELGKLREDVFHNHKKIGEGRGKLKDALYQIQNDTDLLGNVFNMKDITIYDGRGLYDYVARKIISDMTRSRLKKHIKEGNERKLFFMDLPAEGGREFPQVVVKRTKQVVTGTYYPGDVYQSGDECDVVPARLNNAKHHLLLVIDRWSQANWARFPRTKLWGDDELCVLADDCVHNDDLKMTHKLMEVPGWRLIG